MASKRHGFSMLSNDRDSSTDGEMRLEDSESGKRKRYLVKESEPEDPVCNKPLTRRDYICLGIGGAVLVTALVVFLIIGLTVNANASLAGKPWKQVRLPLSILPQIYTIHLEPDVDNFVVTGTVSISALVNTSTRFIVFHSKDMSLDNVTVTRDRQDLPVKQVFNFSENDFSIIELTERLAEGQTIEFSMHFNYTLRDDLVGFYRSSYHTQDGKTHHLATTQFEPTDARRAFPCFDEPAMKANFTISITHRADYTAVSNMPVLRMASASGGRTTTMFQTSYKMSTYLVAFVVSDFKCSVANITSSGVKVGVAINNLS